MQQEDRRLNKAFGDAYRDIKAPEDLKEDTLKLMFAEEGRKQETKKAKRRKFPGWYYGAVAAAACAVLFFVSALRTDGISYVTMMEEDVFYDTVELKDGLIRFLPDRVIISISPNAGQAALQEKDVSSLRDEKVTEPEEQVETKSGGQLKLFKIDALSIPKIGEEDWSYIGEQKIYVSVLETDGMRFHAVYEKGEASYEIIGEDVTQKEFIDYLYQKIK